MDTLSTLLADIRIRDARFVRTNIDLAGHLVVRGGKLPCFHMVTRGKLWLHPAPDTAPILLQAGDVAFFPRGQAHELSGQPVPPGRGEVTLQTYLASGEPAPGSVLSLPPDRAMPHRAGDAARSISGQMLIDGVADAWLWGALPPFLLVRWGERALPHWLQIGLAYLEQELARDQLARQAIINRLGDILFIQSLRSYLEDPGVRGDADPNKPLAGWLVALKDGMISKVIGAMHRDPARTWALQDLARIACVSRSVLAERFVELMGQPPLAYLTHHRMHLAARRLRQSSMSVAEVARSVGYSSAAAFAQAFKREFACSPSTFRVQGGAPSKTGLSIA